MRTNELSKEDLEGISGGEDFYRLTISNGVGKLEYCTTGTMENGIGYTLCKTL
jgi:hypothetical protein